MDFEIPVTQWSGSIREVTVGSPDSGGRSESKSVVVGGQTSLPFLGFEGKYPHPPIVAWEVPDSKPEDWIEPLVSRYKPYLDDPVAWAQFAEKEGAHLICLTLRATNPGGLNRSIEETIELVRAVADSITVPLILKGTGSPEHQGEVLSRCAESLEGMNCLLASADEHNFKTVIAAAMAFGHTVVAETPIDVNLAKQLNILITDMNFPPEKILIDPLTGGLGYGLEYTYSVMERIRLQALNGDPMMQMPFICFVGEEAWRVKEVRVSADEKPDWGLQEERAILWELTTALPLLHAGADILVMRHPLAIRNIGSAITDLITGAASQQQE